MQPVNGILAIELLHMYVSVYACMYRSGREVGGREIEGCVYECVWERVDPLRAL